MSFNSSDFPNENANFLVCLIIAVFKNKQLKKIKLNNQILLVHTYQYKKLRITAILNNPDDLSFYGLAKLKIQF